MFISGKKQVVLFAISLICIVYYYNSKVKEYHTVRTKSFYNVEANDCKHDTFNITYCIQWGALANYFIRTVDEHCKYHEYRTKLDEELFVEFNVAGTHLYGGSERGNQQWPLDGQKYKYPYVSKSEDSQAVLEPYWLTSDGLFVFVNQTVPLFVELDAEVLRLTAKAASPYVRYRDTVLAYIVCQYENAKQAHQHAIETVFAKPRGIPDTKMVEYPIWSTWAKYKADINATAVLKFATNIIANNFPACQLEIDDNWEVCYGSFKPNKKFQNFSKTILELKTVGFRTTLWVHPFINTDCEPYFTDALNSGYFVKNATQVETSWWNGRGGYIDFTNPKAANWWKNRLVALKKSTGIDSFKFDAGESSWTPEMPILHQIDDLYPETIMRKYVSVATEFGNMIEVRVGRGTQQYPIFVRILDRSSSWYSECGINTIIPTVLNFNLLGFSFVLPDMIGGNGYNKDVLTKELFIRWLQVSVFLPTLQFSYPPWDFDEETVKITKKFVNLHYKYSRKIIDLMKNTVKTGTPVNLPLWWIDPDDPVAQTISSEFLLGEHLLVAPVLEENAMSRDIYLPKGKWRDEANENKTIIVGPTWIKDYKADLHTLPYFTKISDVISSASRSPPVLYVLVICSIIMFFVA